MSFNFQAWHKILFLSAFCTHRIVGTFMSRLVGTQCVPTCGDSGVFKIVGTLRVLLSGPFVFLKTCGDSCAFSICTTFCMSLSTVASDTEFSFSPVRSKNINLLVLIAINIK